MFIGPDATSLAVSGGGEASNCHQPLQAGDTFGIAAFWASGHLTAGRCGFFDPTELAALFEPPPSNTTVVWTGLAGAALLGLLALRLRAKRRTRL